MRNAHQDLKYAEKNENHENGKYTLQDVKCGEENRIGGKFRNVHCRTRNMARKPKIMENEKHPLDHLNDDEIT